MELSGNKVKLAHGSGQGLEELLKKIVLPALYPGLQKAALNLGRIIPLEDAYLTDISGLLAAVPSTHYSPNINSLASHLAFTTDSFVVNPLIFPGGDIGKLAACGTINDLAMMGARPLLISVALIIEEGLEIALLRRLLTSLQDTCWQSGVTICCGDTKVVEKGLADGLYITTSGIGITPAGHQLSIANARPGDRIVASGPLGLHGIAVLAARKNLNFASDAISDCAPLNSLVEQMLHHIPLTRALRDCTRGGCAAVLNEIATASEVSIYLEQERIPIPDVVKGACSFLGMDPLHIACEGRFIAVIPGPGQEQAENAIHILHGFPLGQGAAIIGRVTEKQQFPVILETTIGGTRLVDLPPGELLPRIC